MPQHKQRNRTNPQRISFETLNEWVVLYLIRAATKQRMLRLYQFDTTIVLFFLFGWNYANLDKQIAIRKQFQHLVCSRYHCQIVMRERPVGKVHIPAAILLLIELNTILSLPVQYTPHQFWRSFTYFFYRVHTDCKGTN